MFNAASFSRGSLFAAALAAAAGPVHAQAVPAPAAASYDVVSVKPNKSGPNGMSWGSTADGYRATNVSLGMLIQSAWDLKTEDMIYGLPKWDHDARFDVEGKMDAEAAAAMKLLPPKEARAQREIMMQNMLIDRFHLQIHHDVKQLPVYNLNVAKGGFKVKEADPNNPYPEMKMNGARISGAGSMMFGPGQFTGNAVTMASLAGNLSNILGRLVIDKTGLTGKYDLVLKYAPDDAPSTTDPGPSLFSALEEQLGLHLESAKGPVDTIVVDHLEQPTEN